MAIESVGVNSDAFLMTLNSLFETHSKASQMKNKTQFSSALLSDSIGKLKKEKVTLPLTYNQMHGTEDYCIAEVQLSVDLQRDRLEIRETDKTYRRPIIRALTAK